MGGFVGEARLALNSYIKAARFATPSHLYLLNDTGTTVSDYAENMMLINAASGNGNSLNDRTPLTFNGTGIYKNQKPWAKGFRSMLGTGNVNGSINIGTRLNGLSGVISVSAWINLPSTTTCRGCMFVLGDTGLTDQELYIGIGGTYLEYGWPGNEFVLELRGRSQIRTGFYFQANRWYHIIVAFGPATPDVSIFVDGKRIYNAATYSTFNPVGNSAIFGKSGAGQRSFNGYMGGVALYRRSFRNVNYNLQNYEAIRIFAAAQ